MQFFLQKTITQSFCKQWQMQPHLLRKKTHKMKMDSIMWWKPSCTFDVSVISTNQNEFLDILLGWLILTLINFVASKWHITAKYYTTFFQNLTRQFTHIFLSQMACPDGLWTNNKKTITNTSLVCKENENKGT